MQFTSKFFLSYLLLSVTALANNVPVDPIASKCIITPKTNKLENMPNIFYPGNNLYQMAGQFNHATGTKVIILMRIMDKNCIPITGATVKLWQKNSLGYYQTNIVNHHKKIDTEKYDPYFAGSGIATTDNYGRAIFISTMPKAKDPSINISVIIKNNHTSQYLIALDKHTKYVTATKYQKYSDNNEIDMLLDNVLPTQIMYMQDITLDIQQQYKQY
jgi:hypothetical protein